MCEIEREREREIERVQAGNLVWFRIRLNWNAFSASKVLILRRNERQSERRKRRVYLQDCKHYAFGRLPLRCSGSTDRPLSSSDRTTSNH